MQLHTDMRQLLPGDKILDLVRKDYRRFLAEYGLTEAWVTAVVADMSDHAEMPPEYDCYSLGSSAIHGRGLFCKEPIPTGHTVAPARLGVRRTVAGRLTNHSPLPNCRFEPGPDGLLMVSRHEIAPGEELSIDDRQAASVNGWGLQPDPGEVFATVRWRASTLQGLGEPWAGWFGASCVDLAGEVGDLLAKFGHLPSLDVTPVEKQSKETK